MGAFDHKIKDELKELKVQLEKVRLTQRDSSFKFSREQNILRRLVGSLTFACHSENEPLNQQLIDIRESLENNTSINDLIPHLAILERGIKQQTLTMEEQNTNLDYQIRHGGETLLRVPGLPSRVKRELRDLLSYSGASALPKSEQAFKLLSIYEKSIRIISSNPDLSIHNIDQVTEKDLLLNLSDELQTLITEIDFDGESGDQLLDIRAKLLVGVTTHELLELTLDVLRLVVDGTRHERKASEKFLEQIATSIATNLTSTSESVAQSHSYFTHRKEMNLELNQLLSQSQNALKDGTDANQIKSTLSPMFDQLQSLSERLIHAEQREQALIERMDFTKNQMEALQDLTQAYRHRLKDQSERMLQDPLTKVYNRAAFYERLEIEYHRWIKSQHTLRIILFDIDSFKDINDKFGYTAGDKALKIIASTLLKEMPANDTIARFSGEEFIVIMPDHNDNETHKQIIKVQNTIKSLPFKFKQESLTITLSAASVSFRENDTPEEVLDRVYRALVETKKLGINTINWK
jgi:diguanylate cyclase (GGDEF)-like protein